MLELVSYIKKNLRKGYTKESLNQALINQGYSSLTIKKALKRADLELARQAPQLPSKPEIKYQILEPKELATTVQTPPKSFWKKLFDF